MWSLYTRHLKNGEKQKFKACNRRTCVLVSADPTFTLLFANTSGTCIPGVFPPFPPPPSGYAAPASPDQGSSKDIVGPVVGSVVGAVVLLSLAILAFYIWRRRAARKADKGIEAPTHKSPNSLVVCAVMALPSSLNDNCNHLESVSYGCHITMRGTFRCFMVEAKLLLGTVQPLMLSPGFLLLASLTPRLLRFSFFGVL